MAMPAPVFEDLASFAESVAGCVRCPLSEGRTQVVFGSGNPHADLIFVGEAPGFHEDKQGVPFVGAAGQLLGKLLAGIGMTRDDVYAANVLKCRPPGNRDPLPEEIAACEGHLWKQLALIEPKLVATLGNFSTKLLRGDPTGISRLHGQPEVHVLGHRAVRLFPIYHPAAALYTPSMLETLRTDFAQLPELLALGPPPQPERLEEPVPEIEPEDAFPPDGQAAPEDSTLAAAAEDEEAVSADQLGLFE